MCVKARRVLALAGVLMLLFVTAQDHRGGVQAHSGGDAPDRAPAALDDVQQGDVIIDDQDFVNCFTEPCPQPFETYWDSSILTESPFKDSGAGDVTYRGHALWAECNPLRGIIAISAGVRWNPNSPGVNLPAGTYMVSAFIPRVVTGLEDTRCAEYYVRHMDQGTSVTIDQSASPGSWQDLGEFRFGDPDDIVDLSWTTDCHPLGSILFDAIRFRPVSAQPVTLDVSFANLAEGAHVPQGSRVYQCYLINRSVEIYWRWFNPDQGWSDVGRWKDNRLSVCVQTDPLETIGVRRSWVQAIENGRVVASDESSIYVDPPSTLTPVPRATATRTPRPPDDTPSPTRTASVQPSVSVVLVEGCGRPYRIGQTVNVRYTSNASGLLRLRFDPLGTAIAERAVVAGSSGTVAATIQGPEGTQEVVAELLVQGRSVATDSCGFDVQSAPGASATPRATTRPLPTATSAPPPPTGGLLANLSTRGLVESGDRVLIGGFIVAGGPVTVVLRALGPDLTRRGVPGALADPSLRLIRDGINIAVNDDWMSSPDRPGIEAASLAPNDRRESAVLATLQPGSYTAIVEGVGGSSGIALVEVFRMTGPGRLSNISTRGQVNTGDQVMIGGFIVSGVSTEVLIRGIGPDLTRRGVPGALNDPVLTLFSGNKVLEINDDWRQHPQAARMSAESLAPFDPREASILITLAPGAYTAILNGLDARTGIGLVEVFQVGAAR